MNKIDSKKVIHQFTENLQMQDGVFRKVIPTIRDGQEYPLSDLNPKIDANTAAPTTLFQHVEKSFVLSKKESAISTSEITGIGKKINDYTARIRQTLQDIGLELSDDLTNLFNKAEDPYKIEITGIKIEGFKDGELFGVIGLDRALPKNEADLQNLSSFTVPFSAPVDDALEEEQKEEVTKDTKKEPDWDNI